MHRSIRTLACLSLVPLSACGLSDDWDRDGYPAWNDCDDLDPRQHPGAFDAPDDGIDQDCRGGDNIDHAEGMDHDCAISEAGAVWCFGDNSKGQLNLPEDLSLGIWWQLAAGDYHTCALSVLGEVSCWGDNTHGQSAPRVSGPFVSISAGPNSSTGYYRLTDDTPEALDFECWGRCRNSVRAQ